MLKPLLEVGWLEMTVPDKPTSNKQKYRLTTKGIEKESSERLAPLIRILKKMKSKQQ